MKASKNRFLSIFLIAGATACVSSVEQGAQQTEQTWTVESSACSVEYTVTSQWSSGFGANVTVTNKQAAKNGWTVEWDFANGQKVTSLWNGQVSQAGAHVQVKDVGWNASLGSGQSVSFGFNGTSGGANEMPQGFLLNGVSCGQGGSTQPPASGGASSGGASSGGASSGGASSGGSTSGGGDCDAPDWKYGVNYDVGDIVEYNGALYIAEHANPGYDPTISTWFWNPYDGDCDTSSGGSSSGGTSSGGSSSGGSGSGGSSGGDPCSAAGLAWKSGKKTNYTSYPDPGSEECIYYNGCQWAGQFAGCSGQKSEAWVASHNIAALFPGFEEYELHDICIRSGDKTMVVTVYDTCGDSDCSGCCTRNKGSADALIDLESYTNERWGLPDGSIQWADLGPTAGAGCN